MKQESLPSYLQLTYATFPLHVRVEATARPSKGRGHDMDRSGPQLHAGSAAIREQYS